MAKYEVWNEVLCFRTSQRIFHLEKALKLLHSLSFASLQCSCLISGAPEEWFPSLFLAHIMKRKPNPLMGDTGYKKNAHWIEIKKAASLFPPINWILPSEETLHVFHPFLLWQPCRYFQTTIFLRPSILLLSFLLQSHGVRYICHPDDSLDTLYFGENRFCYSFSYFKKSNNMQYVK